MCLVASRLDGCCHDGSKSIQSISLVVAVRFLSRRFFVEHDLACNHELVSVLDIGCLVSFVYFGAGCHYSFDDYKGNFVWWNPFYKALEVVVRLWCLATMGN